MGWVEVDFYKLCLPLFMLNICPTTVRLMGVEGRKTTFLKMWHFPSFGSKCLCLYVFSFLFNFKKINLFFNWRLIILIVYNWRLITLQYCGGFCHTLTWISHRCTCVPHPEPPSYLPPHSIPLGCPRAPALSALFQASNLYWWSISCMVM